MHRSLGGLAPGRYEIPLGAARPLAAGVYLVRILQAGRSSWAKAVVLR